MNIQIEQLISEKIAKIDLMLDLEGSDRKMLQLACKDFAFYIKLNSQAAGCTEEYLNKILQVRKIELECFLDVWVARWMNKWQERVKLLIGTYNKDLKDTKNLEKADVVLKTLDCKSELIKVAQATLINNGEICGSEMLAEHVVKLELASTPSNVTDKIQALALLSNIIVRARQIAKSCGPLIFVEVNKAYYASSKTAYTRMG